MTHLWIDFLNSDWHDPLGRGAADRLDEPAWVQAFCDRAGIVGPENPAGPALRDELRRLRGVIQRASARLIDGKPPADAQIRALNRYLEAGAAAGRLTKGPGGYALRLVPREGGLGAIQLAVAASFARFLVEDDPERLRTCGNPDCRWLFYDHTRSRTQRWCEDSCGNLMKVRRFRARKKG